jgi:hypothetical protein
VKLAPFPNEALVLRMQMLFCSVPGWLRRRGRIGRRTRTELKQPMQPERISRDPSIGDELLSEGLTVHRVISRNARIAIVALGALSLPPFAILLIGLIDG